MAKKKMTKAEWEAFREQVLARAAHTRALAEKAQAELDARRAAESQS
jgi:hypothetical protein